MLRAHKKLLEMMSPHERRRFWVLVGVTFALTVLEVASVASILPFLRLLSEPSLIETVPALAWTYETIGFQSATSFTIWAGVAVFLITVVGLCMKMLTVWLTTRFALMRSYSFSARLLGNYLHQPYEWFLERHSASLGNAILSEVDKLVADALLPAMRIIPEFFTVVLLVVALCFLEPQIAIGGAVLLGGAYGIIYLSVRRLLLRLGKARMQANQTRFHVVQEATGGAKELKIMGLESSFLSRFRNAAYAMAQAQTRGQVISFLPRQAIEAIAFGGMILLIILLLLRGESDIGTIVPTLGLIAAVGLRLIPALQQVYQRSASMKQSDAVLTRLHSDMTHLAIDHPDTRTRRDSVPTLSLKDSLNIQAISYGYPNAEKPALNAFSLSIKANTTIGIVGGTGAGKTTLVDIVLGLLTPSSGEMIVDGTPIHDENRRAWQKSLGYVPQTIFLSDTSVAENIAFGLPRDEIDMDAVRTAARIAALDDFVMTELPNGYDTEVGERGTRLSGGQRQRIGIARALYHNPSTLIFDEATSALDTLTEAAVMSAVQAIAGQKTILMIAHRLTTVRNCDVIFLMRHGQLAASGTFEELAENNEEFRQMSADLTSPKSPQS